MLPQYLVHDRASLPRSHFRKEGRQHLDGLGHRREMVGAFYSPCREIKAQRSLFGIGLFLIGQLVSQQPANDLVSRICQSRKA